MQPNETQPNNTDPMVQQDQLPLSTDDIASAMGFMTTMGQQQMMAQQESEVPEEMELEEEPEENIKKDLDEFKKEIKTLVKDEIKGLKEMITDSMEEDEED